MRPLFKRAATLIVLFSFFFLLLGEARSDLEPAVGTSLSVTPDATRKGGAEFFYDIIGSLGIPIGEAWVLTPGYSLGFSFVSGGNQVFSTFSASLRYAMAESWKIKPAFFETLSHSSDYHSERVKLSLSYLFPEPSSVVLNFGPTFFHDSDRNKKFGGFGGLAGDFTEKLFWFTEAGGASQIGKGEENETDYYLTLGSGYQSTEAFSLSFDVSFFRGRSGPVVRRNNEAAIQPKSSTTIRRKEITTETAVTFTLAADYSF